MPLWAWGLASLGGVGICLTIYLLVRYHLGVRDRMMAAERGLKTMQESYQDALGRIESLNKALRVKEKIERLKEQEDAKNADATGIADLLRGSTGAGPR